MSQAQKIKHNVTTSTEDARALLEDIAAAIGDGNLCVNAGGERVELMPNGTVDVALKVSAKGDAESIRIELSWSKPSPPLRIVTEDGEFRMGPPLPETDDGSSQAPKLASGGASEDEGAEQLPLAQMLTYLSRERLYEHAQKHDLHGRSSMDKAELIVALTEVMDEDDLTKGDRKDIDDAHEQAMGETE